VEDGSQNPAHHVLVDRQAEGERNLLDPSANIPAIVMANAGFGKISP